MNVVRWAETNWLDPQTRRPIRLRPWQKVALLAMFPADGSDPPWTTFLISSIKKAGKTTTNAIATAYGALTFPAPEVVYCVANDEAQAQERVFDMIATAFKLMMETGRARPGEFVITSKEILLSETGTKIVAIAADFAGAAGANYGITSWTETWAFRYEGHVRLFEEMPPLAVGLSRSYRSLRILDSYAGFTGDAPILEPLWQRAVAGERIDDDFPVFSDGRLWAYVDQGEDARGRAWVGVPQAVVDEYYEEESKPPNRPGTFARLHLNQWQSSEEAFITAADWDACVVPGLTPLMPRSTSLSLSIGVDAATRRDCAAVVAVVREGERVRLAAHRIWTPRKDEPLDLEETIEAFVLELARGFSIRRVRFDPMQMERSAKTLEKAGVRVERFTQTSENLLAASQNLYEAIRNRWLVMYLDSELRQHALNAVAVESARGWRLDKAKASQKIDGVVALSFACLGAIRDHAGVVVNKGGRSYRPPVVRRGDLVLRGERYVDLPAPASPDTHWIR